jgi:hypothetical protein
MDIRRHHLPHTIDKEWSFPVTTIITIHMHLKTRLTSVHNIRLALRMLHTSLTFPQARQNRCREDGQTTIKVK